jgi:hypothetical protein
MHRKHHQALIKQDNNITAAANFAYALHNMYAHIVMPHILARSVYNHQHVDSAPVDCAAGWEHVPAGLEQSLEPVLLTRALYPAELAVGNYYAFVEVCMRNNCLHYQKLLWMMCVLRLVS